jgi:hypothetical protein
VHRVADCGETPTPGFSCTSFNDCAAGEACLNGRCIASSDPNANVCTSEAECKGVSSVHFCEDIEGATENRCLINNECPPVKNGGPCPGETFCVLGACVLACGPGGSCPMDVQLSRGGFNGICFET